MHIQPQPTARDIENAPQRSNSGPGNFFSWLMVACGIALVLVWPVIQTMALRNLLLFAGGITGAWYLIRERRNLYQKPALPLLFIFLLLVWVGIHYFLFAHNPGLELEQIKGIWLRVLLACLLGISTGLFVRHQRCARLLIWAGFSSFAIIFFVNYGWVSFTRNSWAIPYPWQMGFYGNKISVVFYGIVALALSCGVISYELMQTPRNDRRNILVSVLCIGLMFPAFVLVDTKNGVVLSLILIFTLLGVYLKKAKKSFRTISIVAIIIIFFGSLSYLHLKLEAGLYDGWSNLSSTVDAGIQIDKYHNWQDYKTYGMPVLEDGSVARESAYLRAAFATKGIQLLLENPLGYGSVDESFKYLTKESLPDAPSFYLNFTHSGWLDFTLGLGIPGLSLTWAALASAFYYSYKQKSRWSYCSRWMLAGAFLVWVLAEVSHNHFVETSFYLIALLAAGNLPEIAKVRHTASNPVETAHV